MCLVKNLAKEDNKSVEVLSNLKYLKAVNNFDRSFEFILRCV